MAFLLAPRLQAWSLHLDLRWIAFFYVLWGLLFLVGAEGVRRGVRHILVLALALAYQAFVWGLVLYAEADLYQHQIAARNLVVSLLFLGGVGWLTLPPSHSNKIISRRT